MGMKHAKASAGEAVDAVLNSLHLLNIFIREPSRVRTYLMEFDDILVPLHSAGEITRQKFGRNYELSLEVFKDPEAKDEYLTLYVRTEAYPDNIMDILDSIDDQYGPMMADKKGYLLVTTDFQKPEK